MITATAPTRPGDRMHLTLAPALESVPRLPNALAQQRTAATRLWEILLTNSHDWLADAGLPDLGSLSLTSLDRSLITCIRGAIAKEFGRDAERDVSQAFETFFIMGLAQGWISSNPMLGQPNVVGRNSRTHEAVQRRGIPPHLPTQAEIEQLQSDCDDWVALGDWITIECGTRPQELRALIGSDIRLHPRRGAKETGGTLTIIRAMGSRENELVPGRTKSGSGQRVVEFGPELAAHLRKTVSEPGKRHLYVVSPDGLPVKGRKLLAARKKRQLRLGIAKLVRTTRGKTKIIGHFDGRKLRRVFAARSLGEGRDHKTLARQMGHKDFPITLNVYAYLLSEQTVIPAAEKGSRNK